MLDLAPVRSESMSSAGESVARADELHDAYLSELLSYSLERLNKEPELLRADADRVRRQMQEEAVGHYRAFITAAKAVQSIRQEITAVDQHLDTLIKDIPALMGGCNRFMEDAQVILEKRRLNRIVLNNHPTLLELLELPQLMDTCVRNGNYDEALDLEAFVAKLATMHAKLPVIQSLAEDVRRTTQTMLQQLLQRLRSKIQLPECLRVIGYLRRLAVFSEHDMRLQVHCTEVSRMAPRGSVKEAWLASILADLDESNPYEFLKRTIDCHREQLFDVVTQYRAIFADDTSQQDEGLSLDGGLLYSWALHRISAYLAVLARTLPKIADGGSLASILEHCMYCGMSLGRVGLDFRGLLPPLFEKCVHSMFATNLAFAVDTFQRVLELYRWVALPALGSAGRSISAGSEDNQDDVAPPYALMEHPPLAAFVNGVLGALNQLRHCAPTALRGQLAEDLQEALQRVARALLRYHDTRVARDAETSLFLALCRSFVEVACPYCALCFGRCYPGGSALIDLGAVCKPMQRLVVASLTAPAEENGNSDGEEATQDEAGGRDIEQSTRGSGKEAAQSSAPEGEEGTEEKHASSLAEVGEVEVNILSLTHTSLIEQVLENGRTDGG